MKSRLQSVLTLLLTCLILGAGTQSAVCELACGLGGNIQCHGETSAAAQSSSGDSAMAGMQEMHCSGMKRRHASTTASTCVRVEDRDGGLCKHPSPVATASFVSRGETVQTVHWVVVEPVSTQTTAAAYRFAAKANAPPLGPAVNSLLITLRV
jgi:hypothetical protein